MIGWLLAAQIAVLARAPDTAAVCQPVSIAVAARADGVVAPRIDFPGGSSLQLLRSSAVSRVERDGAGRPTSMTEATFVVAAPTAGRVGIPPFVARTGSASGRSDATSLDVRTAYDDRRPVVLVGASLDAGVPRAGDVVYVGQQVDYVVDVQLNDAARLRLRRNPTFFPPEMPAALAYDLPAPPRVTRRGTRCFESLSYRRAIFPLFPGAAVISPAVLTYTLPVSTSFFSREESFEARTEVVRFTAVEPPAEGRPVDYAGAVGSVQAVARVASGAARMGDPVLLTVRLEGTGNVKLFPRPLLDVDWAAVAPGGERVSVDSGAARVRGAKEFDWLITPRRAGRAVIAPVRYPYFDPARATYEVAVTDALVLDVGSAALAAADTSVTPPPPIRPTMDPETDHPLTTRPWYWLVLLAAPVPAVARRALSGARRRSRRLSPLLQLRRMRGSRHAPAPRDLRRAFIAAVRDRVPAAAGGAASGGLARALLRSGVTDQTASRAGALLERLDAAAFSPVGVANADLVASAADIASAIDAEAVRSAPRGGRASALLLALLLSAAIAQATQPARARKPFADGVGAYERGEFAAAQRLFARAADRAPRAADAWANLALSAWARGDTAHAALGWQRALRLDPLDAEARTHLNALQPSALGTPAYVAPVAIDHLAAAVLALWTGAWLLLALPAGRRPRHVRPLAGGAIAVAAVALVASLEIREQGDPRGLAAVRTARSLLDAPSGTGGPAAAVTAGEVGRLGAREGGWVRLSVDGARAGWLPVTAVLPLDGPAGAD